MSNHSCFEKVDTYRPISSTEKTVIPYANALINIMPDRLGAILKPHNITPGISNDGVISVILVYPTAKGDTFFDQTLAL